jgi:hypothetical protein
MNASIERAIAMYWRLRQRGQTSLLARLSVEAQSFNLTTAQCRELHKLLCQYEKQVDNVLEQVSVRRQPGQSAANV